MTSDFSLYIYIFIAIVVAIVVIKKITSCLFKTVALLVVVAALAYFLGFLG